MEIFLTSKNRPTSATFIDFVSIVYVEYRRSYQRLYRKNRYYYSGYVTNTHAETFWTLTWVKGLTWYNTWQSPKWARYGKHGTQVDLPFGCEVGRKPWSPHIQILGDPLTGCGLKSLPLGMDSEVRIIADKELQQVLVLFLCELHVADDVVGFWCM